MVAYPFPSAVTEALVECSTERVRRRYPISTPKDDTSKHDHVDTEVIIVTGYGSLKSAMHGIRYGAAGYLLKPFNVTELITLINQTLEKKHRLDFIRTFFAIVIGAVGT